MAAISRLFLTTGTLQLLPKSQRPVDMLFLKDLNLLWENVNAYDYHLRQTLGANAADKILCFANKLEKIVTDEALKVWFGRKDHFVAIDNIDVDKKVQDKACLQLLDNFVNDPLCEIFLEPVDVEGLGLTDYNDVIERPMDLQTLRENVKSGNIYKDPRDFGRDLRLIFQNCCKYNPSSSSLWAISRLLLQRSERAMLAIFGRSMRNSSEPKVHQSSKNLISAVHIHLLASIGFERDHFARFTDGYVHEQRDGALNAATEVKIEYPYTVAQVEEEMLDFYEGGTNGVLWFKSGNGIYYEIAHFAKSKGGIAEIKPAKNISEVFSKFVEKFGPYVHTEVSIVTTPCS